MGPLSISELGVRAPCKGDIYYSCKAAECLKRLILYATLCIDWASFECGLCGVAKSIVSLGELGFSNLEFSSWEQIYLKGIRSLEETDNLNYAISLHGSQVFWRLQLLELGLRKLEILRAVQRVGTITSQSACNPLLENKWVFLRPGVGIVLQLQGFIVFDKRLIWSQEWFFQDRSQSDALVNVKHALLEFRVELNSGFWGWLDMFDFVMIWK